MRLIAALGARANVVKFGPLMPEFARARISCDFAFTGPASLARPDDIGALSVFYGVELAPPLWYLDVGDGTRATRTGRAMVAFEDLFSTVRPDAVMVVGDSDASLAAAISAAKAGLPVVHLEAGLRCGDLRVPEEVNRVLMSRIASVHLTPTEGALENLEDEGVEPERIHFVGNSVAEFALRTLDDIRQLKPAAELGFANKGYVLAALHRPENLDDPDRLAAIMDGLGSLPLPVLLADSYDVRAALMTQHVPLPVRVRAIGEMPYSSMLALTRDAAAVVTDSGGLQEEACVLCVPCLTVRDCTEHTATIEAGANRLVAADSDAMHDALADAISRKPAWASPKRWDRAVSDRVVRIIRRGVPQLV